MSLIEEYKQQRSWRAWSTVLDELPLVTGQRVLDLGCAVGDQTAELVARGARVVGIDHNEALLGVARARNLPDAEFRHHDLGALPDLGLQADGMWASFVSAYFPDFSPTLRAWARHLRPGGWLALTDIDDLFGHQPLSPDAQSLLAAYAREAFNQRRYDFHIGRKLRAHLERCGFEVVRERLLPDAELAFDGPASPEVLEAWRRRLDRMRWLQECAGPRFERLRHELLGCLASTRHRAQARVVCCVAVRPPGA